VISNILKFETNGDTPHFKNFHSNFKATLYLIKVWILIKIWVYIYIKIKCDLNLERDKIAPFKKNGTKLNKNNEYMNQIEHKTLTMSGTLILTHGTMLTWQVDIYFKILKELKLNVKN